jgi:ATP-dependent DNA ligase
MRRHVVLTSTHRPDQPFPEILTALGNQVLLPAVLDGELCVWADERLDFDQLQQRLTAGRAQRERLAATRPASYMVFDLLTVEDRDLRMKPWRERRAALETLGEGFTPPLQLSPYTMSRAEAQTWMRYFRPAGVEGNLWTRFRIDRCPPSDPAQDSAGRGGGRSAAWRNGGGPEGFGLK